METVRASARRLGSFFSAHALDPEREGPAAEKPGAGFFGALSGVRWTWVLAAGAVVGAVPYLLMIVATFGYATALSIFMPEGQNDVGEFAREIGLPMNQFGYGVGAWGMPAAHLLLAFLATSFVVRRSGTAVMAHGTLIALTSVVVGQVTGLYVNYRLTGVLAEPAAIETVKYLALAFAGGLLGSVEARNALSGQEALHRVSQAVSAARDPAAVVSAIGEYLNGPAVRGVALWQAPLGAEDGAPDGSWRRWTAGSWPEDASFDAAALAETGASGTLRFGQLPEEEQRAAWRSAGARSAFLVPLVAPGGAEVGLLAVVSRGRRLPRGIVRGCLTAGAQAALVLENLRLVEEARRAGRQAGVLKERQRMAHEIHDTLAQGFTSIVMNLEAADGVLPEEAQPGPARRHLEQARLTARESLTEARRLVWALRPEALEKLSLPEALEGLARRWSGESGVAAGVAVTGTQRPLSPTTEATLFRAAQEALNNVRKHANASRVALTLSYMGDHVSLDTRDDGAGFDPERVAARKRDETSGGFGLKAMRERIEEAGGLLSVESAPGEGSTLTVELPVNILDKESEVVS